MLGTIFSAILIIVAIYLVYMYLKSGETPADMVNNEEPKEEEALMSKTDTKSEKLHSNHILNAQNLFDWFKPRSIFSKEEGPRNPDEKTKYSFGDVDTSNNDEKDKIYSDLGIKEKVDHSAGTNDDTKPIEKVKTKTNDEIGTNSIPLTILNRNPGDDDKEERRMHPTKGRNGTNNANDPNAPKNLEATDATPHITAEVQKDKPSSILIKNKVPAASTAVKKRASKKLVKSPLESDLDKAKGNIRVKKIDEEALLSNEAKSDLFENHEKQNKSMSLGEEKSSLKKSEKSHKNLLKTEKHLDIDTLIEKTKESSK